MKVGEVLKLPHKDGWRVVRQTGSHRQLHHPHKHGMVTVAGNRGQDLKPKTLASIFKQAGLKPL
jgi:predicted RNA binding protein YcfA (HicA-like mRNA interferase family)